MKKRKKNLIVLFCVAVLAAFCAGAFITIPKAIDADAPQTPQEDNDGNGMDDNSDTPLGNGNSGLENTPGGNGADDNSDNPLGNGNSGLENTPGGNSADDNSDNPLGNGNSGLENTPGGNSADDQVDHFSGNNRDAMLAAYVSVLDGIYTKHVWPDGQPCPIFDNDENYDMSQNDFAIYDIDFDGKDELIINFTNSYMAGMATRVYGYDSILDAVREEVILFPGLTFYDNGIVKVLASHNHGLAATFSDFWPYGLYRYEPTSDSYLQIASLTAWDRAQTETDGQRSFPAEADIDGDGVVYFIELFESDTTLTVDGTEFHQWEESVMGGGKEVDIPFQSITQENISGIVQK